MGYKRKELGSEQLEKLVGTSGKKFVSLEEGAALFSLGKNNFREIAKDAKAIYHIKRRVLVNVERINEYLECFADED